MLEKKYSIESCINMEKIHNVENLDITSTLSKFTTTFFLESILEASNFNINDFFVINNISYNTYLCQLIALYDINIKKFPHSTLGFFFESKISRVSVDFIYEFNFTNTCVFEVVYEDEKYVIVKILDYIKGHGKFTALEKKIGFSNNDIIEYYTTLLKKISELNSLFSSFNGKYAHLTEWPEEIKTICTTNSHINIKPLNITEKHLRIFNEDGFILFDQLIKDYTYQKNEKGRYSDVSYYYRVMHNDDYIHARVSIFKEWFNETYTDNLEKVKATYQVENKNRVSNYRQAKKDLINKS